MIDREVIVPPTMQRVVERAGYAPAVRVGATVYCAGQVGRTPELDVIADPEAQFLACWDNLRTVLEAAGCTFDDVVDMTTYHVGLSRHMAIFRDVKNRVFPRGTCAWTAIGVAELAHPGLLVEIKCVAIRQDAQAA
ncbi:MAG: RidA family protein [Burkholderia sp.]|jgi:enamine deaminase RidA (YjgF/YER057c/UK114 family)|uniref:RidA family protein n=1 Tax=Burkholderia TaxID=32008 RepID=UPI0015891255|nr:MULTISPECIES: RidA family protein [Burkholderia]MBY8607816.1 RidA family protein [Burkholderia arboris]MCA3781076.1 RidA family protein [Burkholderia sp.]MCA3789891.1 RidA family protein [Burkholderia sp.]MCA3795338.1 RidA family protein [Burkholderia sp.]MCA3804905.1 RidA family protein [Burkholderia sp.]